MVTQINQSTAKRKNIKFSRVKHNQRLFVNPEPCFKNPDELIVDRIIKNIKQGMKGKNKDVGEKKEKDDGGADSL